MAARIFKSETQPLNRRQNHDSKAKASSSGQRRNNGKHCISLYSFDMKQSLYIELL